MEQQRKVSDPKEDANESQFRRNALLKHVITLVDQFRDSLNSYLNVDSDSPPDLEPIPIITYEEVVRFFVDERPDDSSIVQGALIREDHNSGHCFFQVFLDENAEIVDDVDGKPYGRCFVARDLDEELKDAFSQADLVIFK